MICAGECYMCTEKNVYCFKWNALQSLINFTWFNTSLKSTVSLLIFCLDDLSVDTWVLSSRTIIGLLPISFLMFVYICFIFLGAHILGALITGLGQSLGEGNGNPLQYSCLENLRDRGTWWANAMGSQRVRRDVVTKQQ